MPAGLDLLPKEFGDLIRSDPVMGKMWGSLDKASKKIVIEAVLKGEKDFEKLIKLLADIDHSAKSATDRMYSFAQSVSGLLSPIAKAAQEYNRYAVSLEKIGSSSQFGVSGLKNMRTELSLVKKEMGEFYAVSNKLFNQGFNTKTIEATFKNLRTVFGNDAMKMASELGDVLQKTPTMRGNLNKAPTSRQMSNLMENGSFEKVIQLRQAGLFGGALTPNASATKENKVKNFEASIESIKDYMASGVPAEMVIADLTLKKITEGFGYVKDILFVVKAISGTKVAGAGLSALKAGGGAGVGMLGKAGAYGGALLAGVAVGTAIDQAYLKPWQMKRGEEKQGRMLKEVDENTKQSGKRMYAQQGEDFWKKRLASEKDEDKKMAIQSVIDTKGETMHTASGTFSGERARKTEETNKRLAKLGASYSEITSLANRQDTGTAQETNIGMKGMRISGLSGDKKGIETGLNNVRKASVEFFNETNSELQKKRKELTEQKESLKADLSKTKNKKDQEEIKMELEAIETVLRATESSAKDAIIKRLETFSEALQSSIDNVSNQGGSGIQNLLGLKMKSLLGEQAIERAVTGGGQRQAYAQAKEANLKTAEDELRGKKAGVQKAQEGVSMASTPEERTVALQKLNEAIRQETVAQQELNSAMKDMRGFEYLSMKIETMSSLASNLSGYLEEVNGSWSAMGPIMKQQLELSEQRLANAKDQVKELEKQGVSGGDEKMIQARAKAANEEINLARQRYDFAKKERDIKVDEHKTASAIMKEQSSFLAEMGGSLGDVLSMKSQALEQDRAAIKHMQEGIVDMKAAGADGLTIAKAENDLKRAEMELVRNQVGIQRDAYEKFAGMAFGSLSDKGYKKGRMDTAVLGGTDSTRIRNLSGMATGENEMGLNRDALSGALSVPNQLSASRGKNKEAHQVANVPPVHKFVLSGKAEQMFKLIEDTNAKMSGTSGAGKG